MKTSILSAILIAVLLTPSAFAEEFNWGKFGVGVAVAVGGGALFNSSEDVRDDELNACARANPGQTCTLSAYDAAPERVWGGILLFIGGAWLALDAFDTDDNNFADNGIDLEYRGNDNFMVSKTWEL